MRGYTVVAASVALNVEYKWLDNLLSHYSVPGVRQARQGVARTLPYSSLRLIALTLQLIEELDASLPRAIQWAIKLDAAQAPVVRGDLGVTANLETLDAWLAQRLAYAMEVAPTPRRGRPPRQ